MNNQKVVSKMLTHETSKQYYASSSVGSTHTQFTNEQELNRKVNRALEKCTNSIYSLSNEPTLACFCISEHLAKSGVQLTDRREEMRKLDKKLSGGLIDIEFSIESIKMMKDANSNFKSAQEFIKNAIFCKQQIDFNNTSKKKFQDQMNKDHSVNDFRQLSATSSNRETKRNAFQRFSTSFEASIEGLASSASVDFKEFKDALKNISQLPSTITSSSSTNEDSHKKSTNSQQNDISNVQSTSSKVVNESVEIDDNLNKIKESK